MSLEGFVQEQEQRNPGWFQPGTTLNPGGKPKSAKLLSDALRNKLSRGAADKIIERLIYLALNAKQESVMVKAAELCFDRTEGKAMQAIQVSQTLDENTARRLVEIGSMLQRIIPTNIATLPYLPTAPNDAASNHAPLLELSGLASDISSPENAPAKRKYVRSGKYVGVNKRRKSSAINAKTDQPVGQLSTDPTDQSAV